VVGGNGSELRPLAGYMSCTERSGYASECKLVESGHYTG